MERLGVAFWGGMSAEDALRCVETADKAGYDTAYVIESYLSQYPFLAACAARTESIRLATGVTTIYTQSPTQLAMAVATVDALSRGRFVLGIGVGHPEIVEMRDSPEGGGDAPTTSPLQRLKETVELVRLIVAASHHGGVVDYQGEVFSVRGWQPWSTAYRPEVMVQAGTFNRKALEYAGESLDGILPVYTPPESVAAMREHVATGAARTGRSIDDLEIACYVSTCLSDDEALARDSIRRQLAFHMFAYAHYRKHFARHGLADVIERIEDALEGGADEETIVSMVPEDIADEFGVYGSVDRIRAGLDRYREAGTTLPVLFIVQPGFRGYAQTTDAGPAIERTIAALSPSLARQG